MAPFQPCRVLILTASMGNGHLQVSSELARRLAARGHTVEVADLLTLMPKPAGRVLRWLYPWLVRHAPWLYDRIYRHVFLATQSQAERASVPVRLSLRGVERLARRFGPDLVVSTYHLAGVAAARLRAAGRVHAATVTFITTFGVHSLWLHPATDLYLCITPAAAAEVTRRTGARAEICEPVVRPQFAPGAVADGTVRRSLRVPPCDRLALIVAGSLGLGAVKLAARTVAVIGGWCPVVVCGHNAGLRDAIGAIPGAVALGWVEDMASLMADADVVLDNAGGSTAKEALAIGRPVITFQPLPGHGRHDTAMMAQTGLTDVTDDPDALAGLLHQMTAPECRVARVTHGLSLFGTDPAMLIEALAGANSKLVA